LLALLLSFEVVAVAAAATVVELPATSFSRVVVPTVGVVAASTDFGGQLTQVFFDFFWTISLTCFSTIEVIVITVTTRIIERQALLFRNVVVPSWFPPRAITLCSR
jgi:hypothetical protein